MRPVEGVGGTGGGAPEGNVVLFEKVLVGAHGDVHNAPIHAHPTHQREAILVKRILRSPA